MPYTKTAKSWGAGTPQPNKETNPGSDTRRHASFCETDTAPGESVDQAKNASDADLSHADLLERLTDATEDQLQDEAWLRETRIAIADAFFSASSVQLDERRWWFSGWHGWETIEHAPEWLHSVDAALTLIAYIPGNWFVYGLRDHRWLSDGSGFSVQLRSTDNGISTGHADTLPAAICIAAVNALTVV